MDRYIIALDIGTTSIKAGVWNQNAKKIIHAKVPSPVLSTAQGKAEQNLSELGGAVEEVLKRLGTQVPTSQWECLSLSTQRGTLILQDDKGTPVSPLISWMDRRAVEFHGNRWEWFQVNAPTLSKKTAKVASLMSWCTEQFTGISLDTEQTCPPEWKDRVNSGLAQMQGPDLVPPGHLASCVESNLCRRAGIPAGLPFILAGGDKNCELIGAGGIESGRGVLSFGTAVSLGTLVPVTNPVGRGFRTPSLIQGMEHVEIGVPFGGALWNWVRTLIPQMESVPLELKNGLTFIPYLAGSLSKPDAKGAILGLSPESSGPDILAAAMEGILLELLRLKANIPALESLSQILVCGEGATNGALIQWVADAFEVPTAVLGEDEIGLLGTAIVAARAIGLISSIGEPTEIFVPPPAAWSTPRSDETRRWAFRLAEFKKICRLLYGE